MKVNSNIQAMIANSVLKKNEEKNASSTEKLSSGYKLNHASDSPAGMAISNKMRAQINSLNKAKDNASNAINVVQTADGALNEVHAMLQRMNELAIQAANGTNSDGDRAAIQDEINQLCKEINRIAEDTEYNTQNLLGGEQNMKGYTNDDNLKVLNYDPDFPVGKYTLTFNDSSYKEATLVMEDGSAVPNLKSVTVVPEYEIVKVYSLKEYDKAIADGTLVLADTDVAITEIDELSKSDEPDGVVIVKKMVGGRITSMLDDGTELITAFNFDKDDPAKQPKVDGIEVEVTGIGGMKVQVGTSAGKEIHMVIPKMTTEFMGIGHLDIRTTYDARDGIEKISKAIDYVSKGRSRIGAYQNRLEATVSSLAESIEDLTQSYSTIKDVNMADEMVNYTTLQVLVQAGTSMLTQANEQPQQALQLLQ